MAENIFFTTLCNINGISTYTRNANDLLKFILRDAHQNITC